MVQVTVSGSTREELIANLASWIDLLSGNPVGSQQLTTEQPAQAEGKKRGRPAKAAPVAQDAAPLPMEATINAPQEATPVNPLEPEQPTTNAALTHESTVAALKGLAALRPGDTGPTDGYQRVSKILMQYGYKNVKDIKAEHFAAIIAACQGGV